MSNYGQSTKAQNYNEMNYPQRYGKNGPKTAYVTRQTNTPPEFLICNKCQEKFTPKLSNQLIGDCQSLSEYSKALNYINSCHKMINQMAKQWSETGNEEFVSMPDLPNFVDLFNVLNNIKQKFVSQERQQEETAANQNENYCKSDEERNEASEDDYENQYEQSKNVTQSVEKQNIPDIPGARGKYLELLPDVKQNEMKSEHRISVPTSETEDSEIELELLQNTPRTVMQNKFKQKIATTGAREKVIYEEADVSDDARNKRKEEEINRKHSRSKINVVRAKNPQVANVTNAQNQRCPSYTPNVAANQPPVQNQKEARKFKPRSASSNTPREKSQRFPNVQKKIGNEVSGNYSDTVITVNGPMKQNKKMEKSLTQPIEYAVDGQLSKQQLDKFAKELLGSGSPSPRSNSPDSRAFRPKSPIRPKIEEKCKTPKSKALTLKMNECKRKPSVHDKCSQSNLAQSPSRNQQVQTVQNAKLAQQQIGKKATKCYSATTSKLPECQQAKINSNLLKSTPKQHNLFMGHRTNELFSASTTGNLTSTKPNLNYSNSCTAQAQNQMVENLEAYAMQQRCKRSKSKVHSMNENCESAVQQCRMENGGQETPIQYVNCNRQVRSNSPKIKVQYPVMTKPNDFFTVNRKNSVHNRKDGVGIYADREDMNIESDDIKTDSDIEEDHFDREENGSLFPNGQTKPEAEQIMNDAKSVRANDERNKPFREPRKNSCFEREDCEIVRIHDAENTNEIYGTTQVRRTFSEESSDIKSDNDDDFEHTVNVQGRNVNYNYRQGNNRYQT